MRDEREKPFILGNALEHLAAYDKRVHPLGRETFEGVAAMMGAEMRCKARADRGQRLGVEKILNDREAVARDACDMRIARERLRRHRASDSVRASPGRGRRASGDTCARSSAAA